MISVWKDKSSNQMRCHKPTMKILFSGRNRVLRLCAGAGERFVKDSDH